MELTERIRAIRKDAGLTQTEFAERIGVKMNQVSFYENGRRAPSAATAREICRQFQVREHWLRTGEGEMHVDMTPAMQAADRVRRLLVDAPSSTAGAVIAALVKLDPAGPEWEAIAKVLRDISSSIK